jgi:hypothetical protein
MGFVGLGIDMGVLRYEKRLQQTAADAGALAGASNLASTSGGVVAGAQAASATNGFADNSGGATCTANPGAIGCISVTVNNPPANGPHAGDAKYVEVLVAAVHPTYFMNILKIPSESITARAVATNVSGGGGTNGPGCLYTLGPPSSSIEGVNINGSAILNAPSCGIVDNGNFNTKGNKLIVNADTFGMSGDWNKSGPGGTVTCSPSASACPATNMPAAGDPLAAMPAPAQPANSSSCPATGTCNVTTSGNMTLQPGSFNSITVGKNSNVTFAPGIYYISGSGGLTADGTSSLTGTGVMFYFTGSATINMTGTPPVNLSAPTSGEYSGILMYQDPNDTNVGPHPNGPNMGGNSGSSFNGVLYFPKDQVTFFGNNTSISVGMLVSDSIALSGNPTINLTGPGGNGGPGFNVSYITNAILVE